MDDASLPPLTSLDGGPLHAAVPGLVAGWRRGDFDRRTLLRTLAWLGTAVAAAPLAGCGPAAPAKGSARTLRFVCAVQQITDPALTTWIEASNLFRNALGYLTEVDSDNIVHPGLAESWRASDDLKTWVFTLRDGVRWSNGDAFGVEDVLFNFRRWLDPASKSVNRTAFAAVASVEVAGPRQVRLTLTRPLCALPEQLYGWTCAIVHRDFDRDGGNWPKNPIGTGPYRLTRFEVGRAARFERRADYAGPAPWLNAIDYVDLGPDVATHVAALAAGQVDILYRVTIAELDLVKALPQARLLRHTAAQTLVLRMRVDAPPFDDPRVRRAVQLSADNARMLALAYRGMGVVGEDHHVAPSQPDYAPVPAPKRDVAAAKALLAAAGHPDGIDLVLTLGNTQGRYEQDTAQIFQQDAADAGIRVAINVVPAAQYWSIWKDVPFGVTSWAHRPLGIMTLDTAYRGGAAWNETGYADPVFDAGLDAALGILEPVARRAEMAKLEARLQDAAVIIQPYWPEKFTAVGPRVRGFELHPSDYFRMERVWLA